MSAVRTFEFHRDADVSGVSGTGVVADGIVFDDGTAVVHWRGDHRSTVVWRSIEAAVAIHGHDGATRLVWTDLVEPTGAGRIVIDKAAGVLTIDGREFPWIVAADGPRLTYDRPGEIVVWVPILTDAAEYIPAGGRPPYPADVGATSSAHSNALVARLPEDELGRTLGRIAEELNTRLTANARCRSCRAPIAWRRTVGKQRMPLDLAPTDAGNIALAYGGTVAVTLTAAEVDAADTSVPRYVSHFATCPDADAWRSKGGDRG